MVSIFQSLVRRLSSKKTETSTAICSGAGFCPIPEPTYEMGNASPVFYVSEEERRKDCLFEPEDDWLDKKRAAMWYICENCDYMTHPPSEGERLIHRCPDGTNAATFTLVQPLDEEAAGQALESFLDILKMTED